MVITKHGKGSSRSRRGVVGVFIGLTLGILTYFSYFRSMNQIAFLHHDPTSVIQKSKGFVESRKVQIHDSELPEQSVNERSQEKVKIQEIQCYEPVVESSTKTNELPAGWCLDEDNTPHYFQHASTKLAKNEGEEQKGENTAKTIYRYTHEGYDQCLANKTIVFIGDSRVRYQFMSLIDFLHTGTWLRCGENNNGSEEADSNCFLIAENMKNQSWNEWYIESTAKTSTGTMTNNATTEGGHRQDHLCDCFRPDPFVPKETSENRFITRTTKYGQSKLIFFQNFKSNTISLNADFPPFSPPESTGGTSNKNTTHNNNNTTRCSVGSCRREHRREVFRGGANETLWKMIPKLNATHVVASNGWFDNQDRASQLACDLKNFAETYSDIVKGAYWISHPAQINGRGLVDPRSVECNANVFDRTTMSEHAPAGWYWDGIHVLGILNEEFNHMLMEKICPMEDELLKEIPLRTVLDVR